MSDTKDLKYIHGVGWVNKDGSVFGFGDPFEYSLGLEDSETDHTFVDHWMSSKKSCEHEWANISLFRIIYACKYCGEYKDKKD
jgi:hypothetical protein